MKNKPTDPPGEAGDPYCNLPDSGPRDHESLPAVHDAAPPPYSLTDQVAPSLTDQVTPSLPAPSSDAFVTLDSQTLSQTAGAGVDGVHITTVDSGARRDKSLATAYFLAAGVGFLGVHHFYLSRPRFGLLYLLTFGLFGLGWLTDLCRLPSLVSRTNSRRKDPASYFRGPEDRDLMYVYLMWLPSGLLGAHHYYLRRWKWAVLYTFTLGLFGIGWIVDAFRIPRLTRDTNRKLAEERANTMSRGPQLKKLCSAYLLWMPPLGLVGAHHYYLGRKGFGTAYSFTGGLFIAGWLGDVFRMPCLVNRINKQIQYDFQQASEGHIVTSDKTKHVDDAYILHCGPFGLLGAAHFYLGRFRWAFPYFFTLGFFGIGWIIDMFRMSGFVKEANKKLKIQNQVRIQYGPNTQIIVVTDGRVVAGADTSATGPVIIPAIPVPGALGTHQAFHADQPPSYDSVLAEGGATGGCEATTDSHVDTQTKTEMPRGGVHNPVYEHSLSHEDHQQADSLPEKKSE